jgi:hypothetical protein
VRNVPFNYTKIILHSLSVPDYDGYMTTASDEIHTTSTLYKLVVSPLFNRDKKDIVMDYYKANI